MLSARQWSYSLDVIYGQPILPAGWPGELPCNNSVRLLVRSPKSAGFDVDVGVGTADCATESQPLDFFTRGCELFPVSSRTVHQCAADGYRPSMESAESFLWHSSGCRRRAGRNPLGG